MVLNAKGQALFFSFMLGLVIIILALALAGPVKNHMDDIRSTDNLNCSSTTISDYDKAACVVTDLSIFHFVGGLIFIGGAVLVAKIIL